MRCDVIGLSTKFFSWEEHSNVGVRRLFFQRLSCRCAWLNMSKPFECNVVRFREPADKCAGPIEPRRLFMCHSNPDVCARIITGTIALTFSSSFYSPGLIWRKTFWVEENDPMDIIRMTISYIHREALVWWSIHLWQHWRPLKVTSLWYIPACQSLGDCNRCESLFWRKSEYSTSPPSYGLF